jgi:spore coat protein U-like protein
VKTSIWIAFGILASCPALAATSCEVSATGLAFGSYDAISDQHVDTLGTITVTCTGTVGDAVNLELTLNAGNGSFANRLMSDGSHTMHYNLYKDGSHSQVWGDGTGGTGTVTDSFTMGSSVEVKNYTVYGRIFASQNHLVVQSYTDSVAVTLYY